MRAALCGASGTGKSTIALWLSETYGLPMNPIGAMGVAERMGFSSVYDLARAGLRPKFRANLFGLKTAWEEQTASFVTDRSTLDDLTYGLLHDVSDATKPEYFDAAIAHMARYELVIHCPARVFCAPSGDAKRLVEPRYHRAFDVLLSGLLREAEVEHGFSVLELLDPGLSERKALIGHVLEGFGVHPIVKAEVA